MGLKKSLSCAGLAILIIYILLCKPSYANEHKTAELNRKMAEISSLQQSLSDKISQAKQRQKQLNHKIDELEKEIKAEKEQLQIESYLKAIRVPRIQYNLQLIQLLFGYTTRLTEKIIYFQNGCQTLDFFRQQAQDDLLMIRTLNDMEIDKLITNINLVLDEFIPELSKPVFDTQGIVSKDTEKIWNEIFQQRNVSG
jgi:hypothetical protein